MCFYQLLSQIMFVERMFRLHKLCIVTCRIGKPNFPTQIGKPNFPKVIRGQAVHPISALLNSDSMSDQRFTIKFSLVSGLFDKAPPKTVTRTKSWNRCQTKRFEFQVGELDDMTGWWLDQVAAAGFRSGDDHKPKLGSSHLLHPHLSIRWAQQINYH